MVQGVIRKLKGWLKPPEEDYEVEEYVLSRREPNPENRIKVYDSPTDSEAVEADESLPPGIYILQEIKSNGMAGEVVWEEELDPQ